MNIVWIDWFLNETEKQREVAKNLGHQTFALTPKTDDEVVDFLKENNIEIILIGFFLGMVCGSEVIASLRKKGFNFDDYVWIDNSGDPNLFPETRVRFHYQASKDIEKFLTILKEQNLRKGFAKLGGYIYGAKEASKKNYLQMNSLEAALKNGDVECVSRGIEIALSAFALEEKRYFYWAHSMSHYIDGLWKLWKKSNSQTIFEGIKKIYLSLFEMAEVLEKNLKYLVGENSFSDCYLDRFWDSILKVFPFENSPEFLLKVGEFGFTRENLQGLINQGRVSTEEENLISWFGFEPSNDLKEQWAFRDLMERFIDENEITIERLEQIQSKEASNSYLDGMIREVKGKEMTGGGDEDEDKDIGITRIARRIRHYLRCSHSEKIKQFIEENRMG